DRTCSSLNNASGIYDAFVSWICGLVVCHSRESPGHVLLRQVLLDVRLHAFEIFPGLVRRRDVGHYSMECNWPRPQGNTRNGERRVPECYLYQQKGHTVEMCPGIGKLRGLVRNASDPGTPALSGTSQQ
ncbi:hypothetical protein JG687_00015190, partial [Phytophthora cactorum]